MDDLIATFVPKFVATARTRVAKSLDLAANRTPDGVSQITRELHAIAGEAGLLGLGAIVALARAGEDLAKRLRTTKSDADADALLASLTELQGAIESVAPAPAT